MKRRVRKVVNFFAFNLLFFALYLNFIHKDKANTTTTSAPANSAVFSGTVPVENPENYLNKANAAEEHSDKTVTKTNIN